ncbi:MAG: hypothetical protein H7Z41_01280 [Cytophagales bacterium]|nr:hypothetical protein [Armatimonadota bacterium]
MDEQPSNNPDGIAEPEATLPAPAAAVPPLPPNETPFTSEKALDIVLGVALIAGEALDKAVQRLNEHAKEIQEQSPTFWDAAEERGRPVREKIVSALQGGVGTGGSPITVPAGSAGGFAESLRSLGNNIGITVGGGGPSQSAEDEIRALEDRVRELEQVVATGQTGQTGQTVTASVPAPPVETQTAPEPAAEIESETRQTPAESSTYAFGVDQHEDFLAASPYAVSETDNERAVEASASETDTESLPEPQEPSAPSETTLPPATRASRKKQRDLEEEATEGSTPPPASPEL